MKKGSLLLGVAAITALAGCGKTGIKVNPDKQKYVVGIAQFVPHVALDAATNGFKSKLATLLTAEGREVEFVQTDAAGDPANCPTIISTLVSKDVDLILANATPCLSAAYTATSYIPILGTSVTDFGVACKIEIEGGKTKTNVSGTSDLAPLDGQVNAMKELCPDATKFGILYSASEANSKFQVDEVKKHLEAAGKTVTTYPISGSDTLTSVCNTAAAREDVIYIPTDNFCADNTASINQVFEGAGKPVFAGESGICKGCGFATLSIDYTRLGEITGEMAFNVLLGKKDIREYEIQYDRNVKKLYVPSRCTALGIDVPEDAGYEVLPLE